MSGNKLFLDTNIILYLLAGDSTLAELLDGKQVYVSFITELELLSYRWIDQAEQQAIGDFMSQCKIISINESIKEKTVTVRKSYATKLPDSIIIATALYLDLPLITSDKNFKKVSELTLLHYDKV